VQFLAQYNDGIATVVKTVLDPLDNNVFFVMCDETGESVMIDAPSNADFLASECAARNVRKVLVTHRHWDHVGAIDGLREHGIEVGIGAEDVSGAPTCDFAIHDGDVIEVGQLRVRAITTPGHTQGSTCFHVENTDLLFTGDTLFPGGPGATHFPGGDFPTIMKSIDGLLRDFPDHTIVLAGHGDSTTIGVERPNMAKWANRGW
jgi:glyoxylase-like metal-dependent hydrolase (beta-lactamase superfamily II)